MACLICDRRECLILNVIHVNWYNKAFQCTQLPQGPAANDKIIIIMMKYYLKFVD